MYQNIIDFMYRLYNSNTQGGMDLTGKKFYTENYEFFLYTERNYNSINLNCTILLTMKYVHKDKPGVVYCLAEASPKEVKDELENALINKTIQTK